MPDQPIQPPEAPTIGKQRPLFEALTAMSERFAHLPAPYITVTHTPTAAISLQLANPQELEAWRIALQIPPLVPDLHSYANIAWVSALTMVHGVRVELMADVPTPGHLAQVPPAEDARRQAQAAAEQFEARRAHLVEQRNKLAEPEPTASVAAPVADDSAAPEMAAAPGGAV